MLKLGKIIVAVVLGLGCVAGASAQTIEEIEEMLGTERMGEMSFNLNRMSTYSYVYDDFTLHQYRFFTNHVVGYASFSDTPVMNFSSTKNFSFTLKEEEFKGFSEEYGDMDQSFLYGGVNFSAYFYSPYVHSSAGLSWSIDSVVLEFEVYGYNGDGSRDLVGFYSSPSSFDDFTDEYVIVNGNFDFDPDFRYPYYLLQVHAHPQGYYYSYGDDFFVLGSLSVDVWAGQGFVVSSPAIPEPETWAMLLAGLGIVGVTARRRRARA